MTAADVVEAVAELLAALTPEQIRQFNAATAVGTTRIWIRQEDGNA